MFLYQRILFIGTWTNEMNTNCHLRAGLSYQIDKIYSDGSQLLCTKTCQCNADANLWPAPLNKTMATSKMGSSSLFDCPTNSLSQYQRDKIVPVMLALE